MTKTFAVVLVAVLVVNTFAATVFDLSRDAEEFNRKRRDTVPEIECYLSTPCGWAVYTRFTRTINYFMRNKCECPVNKKCVRTEDDLSTSAYIYRCKEESDKPLLNNVES